MTKVRAETTLEEIRRANLHGRLYPHPPCVEVRRSLRILRAAGLADRVPGTPTALGGWFAGPEDEDS